MSADGSVTLVWGDGENKFRFAIGQFRELQERINQRRVAIGAPLVGPMTLLATLRAQDAWPDDIRDVLRIGLVGAGMSIKDANRKLSHHFDNKPPFESMLTAYAALFAGLVGVPDQNAVDEDVKKKDVNLNLPIDFRKLYGTGAALGFTPREVDDCSFWQLGSCVEGFNEANGGKSKPEPMSNEEFDELLRIHNVSPTLQ